MLFMVVERFKDVLEWEDLREFEIIPVVSSKETMEVITKIL